MYFDRNQEVPTLEEFENQMYNSDFVLPDYLLGAEEELMFEVPDVKKEEDEYIDYSFAAEGYEIRVSNDLCLKCFHEKMISNNRSWQVS